MKKQTPKPKRIDVNQQELESVLAKVKSLLPENEYEMIECSVQMVIWLQIALKEKNISIAKLHRMFFEKKTESQKNLNKRAKSIKGVEELAEALAEAIAEAQKTEKEVKANNFQDNLSGTSLSELETVPVATGIDLNVDNEVLEKPVLPEPKIQLPDTEKEKKGHGHRPLDDYNFSKITYIMHDSLKKGDACPICDNGKVYNWTPTAILVFKGQEPLKAEAHVGENFRCNKCHTIFRATFPKKILTQPRADITARAIVCLAKYQLGTPLYRLQTWQNLMKVPIADSVMWEWTESVALVLFPVHNALTKIAAKGEVMHCDDTTAKILDLMAENERIEEEKAKNKALGIKKEDVRVGIYTSVILSKHEGRTISFFCTGRKNSGENFDDLLDHRPKGLKKPVQICDASPSNAPERHETEVSKCFNHARHNFCELIEEWPKESLTAIQFINIIFRNDRATKEMAPEDRLKYHQTHSKEAVDKLYKYCNSLLNNRIIEPNSPFGKAIKYLNNHKEGLCLFLKNGLASISNNDAERAIKSKVLIRKNSYFYKSTWGAFVGDILLGTIKTCELNKINPFDYLMAIQANVEKVEEGPDSWLPWNYTLNVSCPHVKEHPLPVVEVHQNGSTIIHRQHVDIECKKKTFREKVKAYFEIFRTDKILEVC